MKLNKVLVSAAALSGIAAATTAANADSVTVKAGDTVSELAEKYNTTVEQIKNENNLTDVNFITVGQTLTISTGNAQQAQQPVQSTTPTQQVDNAQQQAAEQAAQQKAAEEAAAQQQAAQQQTTTSTTTSSNNTSSSSSEEAAKAWIAQQESGGDYSARNGQYIGKYQLSASYLNGDYSEANQEKVADQYVASRYGSWANAQQHWQEFGWY